MSGRLDVLTLEFGEEYVNEYVILLKRVLIIPIAGSE